MPLAGVFIAYLAIKNIAIFKSNDPAKWSQAALSRAGRRPQA
jgi:hypothetical protein